MSGGLRMAKAAPRVTDGSEMVPLREAWPLWMRAETAARYLDMAQCAHPARAFRQFAKRVGLLPRGRRGDVPLFHRADLDRVVRSIEGAVGHE